MLNSDTKTYLVDLKIEDNIDVLLASFGLKGIMKSNLKFQMIKDIISSLPGDVIDNIDLFFHELKVYYLKDRQFKIFKTSEIRKYIFEERGYVTAHLVEF